VRLRGRGRAQRLRRRARPWPLLGALIASTEAAGIWTIQTGVVPENTASLRLHQQVGFDVVGRRKRIGKREGVWRNVIAIERRSAVVD
jgi:L-amino acid N-acyltransferase YncA